MEFTSRIIDTEATAERIKGSRCAWEFAPCERDGIDNCKPLEWRPVDQGQLCIKKLEIEFGVVDHQVTVTQKGDEILRHVGEKRVGAEKFRAESVDPEGLLGHVALGIDISLVSAARWDPVDELEAGDFYDAVAGGRVKARGFGIKYYFPHAGGGFSNCLVRTPPQTVSPASGPGFFR